MVIIGDGSQSLPAGEDRVESKAVYCIPACLGKGDVYYTFELNDGDKLICDDAAWLMVLMVILKGG
jgi:hypothetical protein